MTAGTDEKAGEVIAELDEEARKIFEELDEEARRTIEELEEEEEQPFENMNALTAKASSAEGRDQVEGQMNLLDMMSDLGRNRRKRRTARLNRRRESRENLFCRWIFRE